MSLLSQADNGGTEIFWVTAFPPLTGKVARCIKNAWSHSDRTDLNQVSFSKRCTSEANIQIKLLPPLSQSSRVMSLMAMGPIGPSTRQVCGCCVWCRGLRTTRDLTHVCFEANVTFLPRVVTYAESKYMPVRWDRRWENSHRSWSGTAALLRF